MPRREILSLPPRLGPDPVAILSRFSGFADDLGDRLEPYGVGIDAGPGRVRMWRQVSDTEVDSRLVAGDMEEARRLAGDGYAISAGELAVESDSGLVSGSAYYSGSRLVRSNLVADIRVTGDVDSAVHEAVDAAVSNYFPKRGVLQQVFRP